jgi:hypothetical protein
MPDGHCGLHALAFLSKESESPALEQLRADFSAHNDNDPRGAMSVGNMIKVCTKLGIPCMSSIEFYEFAKTLNFSQLGAKAGSYDVSPCVIFCGSHFYVGFNPRTRWTTKSAEQILEAF